MRIDNASGGSAYKGAYLGIQRGVKRLAKSALEVANSNGSPNEQDKLKDGLVESKSAHQQIEASATILERARGALGKFIDTLV